MRKITVFSCLVLFALTCGVKAYSQDPPKSADTARAPEPPAHYYHLEFLLQEVGADGKPTNTRNYSAIVSTGRNEPFSAIKTGLRVPILTGAFHAPNEPGDGKQEYQFQYVDVGVNIDTKDVREIGRELAIHLSAEVSSVVESTPTPGNGGPNDPVIRQNAWQGSVLIPIGKPTVAFSSDAIDSKGGMQLVVTATPIQ